MSVCTCAECAPRVPRREHDERDVIAAAVPDDELARWTGVGTGSIHGARADESNWSHDLAVRSAQLHAALTVVRDLLACIDPKAHAWQPQQDAISRAKQLLEEWNRG